MRRTDAAAADVDVRAVTGGGDGGHRSRSVSRAVKLCAPVAALRVRAAGAARHLLPKTATDTMQHGNLQAFAVAGLAGVAGHDPGVGCGEVGASPDIDPTQRAAQSADLGQTATGPVS